MAAAMSADCRHLLPPPSKDDCCFVVLSENQASRAKEVVWQSIANAANYPDVCRFQAVMPPITDLITISNNS